MASSVQNNRVTPSGYCMCCRVCNMWCWRAFKWIPVLLILAIVTWSYYAYVIQLCIFTIESTVQQSLYLVFYHILLIMFVWSYWRTIFAEIKPIPEKYRLPESEIENLLSAETEDGQRQILENFAKDLPIATSVKNCICKLIAKYKDHKTKSVVIENFARSIPVLTRTMSGSVRYCNRCVLVKPDRAHHCSICGRCVLKMDHHCPWVNNCVCFYNYKFFMLFLGYALLYCAFVMFTCLPYFIQFWKMYNEYKNAHCDRMIEKGTFSKLCKDIIENGGEFGLAGNAGRYHIVFVFFVALMFGISLGSLFGYHCYLVATNRTTLDLLVQQHRMGGPTRHIIGQMLSALYSEKVVERRIKSGLKKRERLRRRLRSPSVTSGPDPGPSCDPRILDLYSGFPRESSQHASTSAPEAFRAPMFRGGVDSRGFSLGAYGNFKEVFGKNPHLWLLPVFSSLGDGCEFPVRREHQLQTFTTPQEHNYDSMGTTRSSIGHGTSYPLPIPEEDTESLLSSERWDRWGERARPFDERESSSFDEL